MGNNYKQNEIRQIIANWIDRAEIQQKDLSKYINITPASLNKFLKADGVLFPFPRFLQIVQYLNPPQEEINQAFIYFLESWGIPENQFLLQHIATRTEDIVTTRTRVHALIERLSFEQLKMIELMLNGLLTNDK